MIKVFSQLKKTLLLDHFPDSEGKKGFSKNSNLNRKDAMSDRSAKCFENKV